MRVRRWPPLARGLRSPRTEGPGGRPSLRVVPRLPATAALTMSAMLLAGCGGSTEAMVQTPTAGAGPPTLPSWVTTPEVPTCPATAATAAGQLPGATLACLDGRSSLALDRLPARPYLINLWASWCEPCRQEAPRLAAAAAASAGRVQFLGVDTADGRDPALAFLHDFGISYPQVADPTSEVLHGLPAPGLPVTLAVDARGRVVYRRIGEISADQLAAAVRAIDPAAAPTAGGGG